jgi:bifunctional non-homologous end joining protein LigD
MSRNLTEYRRMRDFRSTPEPRGAKAAAKGERPSFVVQKHRASHLHYDFRLEVAGVLKSWAVPKGPSYDPSVKRLAMMTEDHPYEYGSFEGVIPAGNYGAGNVIIWDHGEWELVEPDDPSAGLKDGKLTFRLYGKKLFGEWALVKLRGKSASKGNEWLLLKHRDEWANGEVDVTEVAPLSVVSGREVDALGEGDPTWKSHRGKSGSSGGKAPAKKKTAKKKTAKKRKS